MMAQSLRKLCFAGVVVAMAVCASRPAWGAVSDAEDLTGCKLPNLRVVLPVAGSAKAEQGALLKFKTGGLVGTPKDEVSGQFLPPDQVIEAVKKSEAADVEYIPNDKGSLWALSGYIEELGAGHLVDYSGKALEEAGYKKKTSRSYAAGESTGVSEGFVYLLKTTDGKWALLRILEKTETAIVGQAVLQPDGSTTFDIPRNKPVVYQRPTAADPVAAAPARTASPATSTPAAAVASDIALATPDARPDRVTTPTRLDPPANVAAAPADTAASRVALGPGDHVEPGRIVLVSGAHPDAGLEPTITTFTAQRSTMIQRRLEIIATPARTADQVDRKTQAINDLVALHADESVVADLLVSEIAFLNQRSPAKEFSADAFHPAYAALKKMGKAGTAAAIKGLRKLDLDGGGDGIDAPVYKVRLLGMAIRSIEGDDMAEYLLKREAEKETDPKRKAVFEFLLSNK